MTDLSGMATELAAWVSSYRFTATVLMVGGLWTLTWVGCAVALVLRVQKWGEW